MRWLAATALAVAAVPAGAQDGALVLPERLASLVKVGGARGTIVATYVEPPGGPGSPLATVYDRALGVTPVHDMATNEEPLRVIAGVTTPGVALAAGKGCPDLVGRIDRGRMGDGETLTASLFATKNGRNVKLRLTVPGARGEPFVRGIVDAFRIGVLGC